MHNSKITPFTIINNDSIQSAQILLICDHASSLLPCAVEEFVTQPNDMNRHIAVDIGAKDVTLGLAQSLKCPAILAGYSRLYIDLNRPIGDLTSMRSISDGSIINGNKFINTQERQKREKLLFHPYHDCIETIRSSMSHNLKIKNKSLVILFVHSFTPQYKNSKRPWNIGILSNSDKRLSSEFITTWQNLYPKLLIGDNEPYSGESSYSYSIHRHASSHNHLHIGLEIRQDLINTPKKAQQWSAKISKCTIKSLEGVDEV